MRLVQEFGVASSFVASADATIKNLTDWQFLTRSPPPEREW
jgi:hypothetical protein